MAKIWSGRIPNNELDDLLLVRNVGLDSHGGLDQSTLDVTKSIDIPHHQGAGGRSNFVSDEAYDKHMKLNARWKEKRSKRSKRR